MEQQQELFLQELLPVVSMLLERSPQPQATAGEAFSFSSSYLQGDAVSTSAASVGTVGNFSSQTSYTAGVAGDLAGTIATDGGIAITAGGAW